MAMTFWWLGSASANSATVCIRGESNGTVAVSCAGAVFSGTVDTSVNDGVVAIVVTGLLPASSYDFSVTDAVGGSLSGSLRTMPKRYGKVAFMSCLDRVRALDDLAQNVIAFGADCVHQQGDYIYCAAVLASYNGETSTAITTASVAADYAKHWRQVKRRSDMRLLETRLPSVYQFDDHEFGGDNWDHSVTQAQASLNVASGGTQAEVDNSWWQARQACAWYCSGNPTNTSELAQPEKPGAAANDTPASHYPVNYFSYSVGDIEVFSIDCISYRSIVTATDNSSKTMLGANQKAWLKAALAASTATWKVIASDKSTYFATTSGTGDDWSKYTTERNELIDFIHTNTSGNLRGVVWVAGDPHAAFVAYDPTKGHICMVANPAGVDHLAQTAAYQSMVVWKEQGNSGANSSADGLFGLVEAFDGYLLLRLISEFGGELWCGRVDEGTNALLFPA